MGTVCPSPSALGLLAVSIAISLPTLAQTPTATLTGRVTDPKGLPLLERRFRPSHRNERRLFR